MQNKTNPLTEKIFNQTKSLWHAILNKTTDFDDLNEISIDKFPLLDMVDTTNSVVVIYNYQKFHPEFCTKNVKEILGFSKEELLAQGSKLMNSRLHPTHAQFPLNLAKQLQPIFKDKNYNENSNLLATICGLKFVHPEKGLVRILMQQYFIENDERNLPIRIIGMMRDITHLMKGDAYFIRNIYGDKHQYTQIFHSEQNSGTNNNDIISIREKEVLELISKDKDTDEIAEILGISRNTVRNHRQNMLDRMGAKDMTALMELARICHIL